jgi:peptidoglycan/xylan/chitin deacetylase (PgdA/CDA1 family)
MKRFVHLPWWMLVLLLAIAAGGASGPARGAEPVMVWAGPPQEKAVALTFDDGPSPIYTPQILSLLKRYGARATFFVIGRKVEQNPGLVHAELKNGNEVGNHSFSHPYLTKEDQSSRERQLERTAVDLDLLGCPQKRCLFRPPYSACDERLKFYMVHTGRRIVMWSLDSGDWRGLPAPQIIQNVLGQVRNGAIIIFHDSDERSRADRRPTVEALRTILPALKAAGYRLVTVSELVKPESVQTRSGVLGN